MSVAESDRNRNCFDKRADRHCPMSSASTPRLDCDASRLESAYLDVSMLEMKLNTTATVDAVGLDPINVVPYQKTRQLRDRTLILQ